jgi:SAM-dependent methyltransferase
MSVTIDQQTAAPASPTPSQRPQEYKPYYSAVLAILDSIRARTVLDAPCGTGWLGRALQAAVRPVTLDGMGLWEFPAAGDGYRNVVEHDLDRPLPGVAPPSYDAVVCCEAIHLMTNPGVVLESFAGQLRPGGTLIITTPNTWNMRSRFQFLLRGFHSGFRPMVGKQRGEYITYFPWTFSQLHLLLTTYGYQNIVLHEVDEPKPKRRLEHILALPSRLYCRRRYKKARTPDERDYWKQAGSGQSIHGRWLVVSAVHPGAAVCYT